MRIIVIGGYGNFGKRLVKSLLEHYDYDVLIGGRSSEKGKAFQEEITKQYKKQIELVKLDVISSDLNAIFTKLSPDIVVNASGPYQYQTGNNNYAVAKACIAVGSHYVDLADDRKFVSGFSRELDAEAKKKNLMLVCGASTVPGLSAAVLDHYQSHFSSLQTIHYGISPGNRTERGEGTIASILSYTGKPFATLEEGSPKQIFGWQDLNRYDFGMPLGKRWMGNCDIPDLELLPQRYPDLKSIKFQAGLEVTVLHVGLWFLSLFTKIKLMNNWSRYSGLLTKMSEWFIAWGTDSGGMFVNLTGVDLDGKTNKVAWQLVAEKGVGPNVPIISAELIVKNIAEGNIVTGAMPCMGLFTLEDFFAIAARWGIYQKEL